MEKPEYIPFSSNNNIAKAYHNYLQTKIFEKTNNCLPVDDFIKKLYKWSDGNIEYSKGHLIRLLKDQRTPAIKTIKDKVEEKRIKRLQEESKKPNENISRRQINIVVSEVINKINPTKRTHNY